MDVTLCGSHLGSPAQYIINIQKLIHRVMFEYPKNIFIYLVQEFTKITNFQVIIATLTLLEKKCSTGSTLLIN